MPRGGHGQLQQLAVRHSVEKKSDDVKFHEDFSEVGESEYLIYDGKKEVSGGNKLKGRQQDAALSYHRRMLLHVVTSFLVLAHLASSTNYLAFKMGLYWRELEAAVKAPWLLVVLCCEVVYVLCAVIAAVDYLIPPNTRLDIPFDNKRYPTVHVLLPTCNEPTDVPKESILAALAMHYPKDRFKVLVLDDGPDEELKAFCQAVQVESGGQQLVYLRRTKVPGVPHNFKCGNINFGLEHSDAEYVVVMDADMILSPSFLRRVLPHIVDSPEVSFVQIPQSFYNLLPGDPLNDSSMMWYERVLVHRDSLGCATCIGTGVLLRRKHLNVIGGFQPQSIAEDTLTAFVLFNHGFKSVYLNEKLQVGITPWSFQGYIRQRQRWGLGAIQQFAATWKTMLGWRSSNLSLVQQLLYFWHTGYYYLSVINLALMAALLAALAFRLNITVGDSEDNRRLISYLAVTLVMGRLAWMALWLPVPMAVLSRNRDESHFWWMTPFFFHMVCQSLSNWRSTFSFVPTSNVDRAAASLASIKSRDELKSVRFHLMYAAVVLAVVLFRVYITLTKYGLGDCRESFFTFGLSVFLFGTAVHMLVPVFYILSPNRYKPADRRSLLRYDPDGVPRFTPGQFLPKWHPSLLFYEAISCTTLLFWTTVLYVVNTGLDLQFCRGGSF